MKNFLLFLGAHKTITVALLVWLIIAIVVLIALLQKAIILTKFSAFVRSKLAKPTPLPCWLGEEVLLYLSVVVIAIIWPVTLSHNIGHCLIKKEHVRE